LHIRGIIRIMGAMKRWIFILILGAIIVGAVVACARYSWGFNGFRVEGGTFMSMITGIVSNETTTAVNTRGEFPILTPFTATFCDADTKFFDPEDKKFCTHAPMRDEFRLFEINLTENKILFYEHGMLRKTFPVAYQAPYGKWFQTPTGYFNLGVKNRKFMSSIVPVYMEYAVQLYEDFFVHAIPYHPDGTRDEPIFGRMLAA
jgi:hypothetical protein